MLTSTLLALPAELCLTDIRLENEAVLLYLKSTQTSCACPVCARPSSRVHGRYTRTLVDLSCQEKVARLRLEVRRFVCLTRTCPRTTFAERFPMLTRTYARRTLRQADVLKQVAFALGGKAGARLAHGLAMPTSRDTLLRLIRSTSLPPCTTPRVLGLDDFAWKKGDRYGTLLVDLEAHTPVEMLADREAASVTRWLRTHPGVKLISRDRAGAYAEGAKRGAPRATQVADRFHVLVNLREAIQDSLTRHQDRLPMMAGERAAPPTSSPELAGAPESGTSPGAKSPQERSHGERRGPEPAAEHGRILTAAERRRQVSRTNRLARYEQIVTLCQQGFSERAIAQQMRVSRQVVHRFVSAGRFPERAQAGRRQSKLDPFLPYLRHRWKQGCRNGLQLAREIQAQGYCGSASLVSHLIGDWRANSPRPPQRERGRERQAAPPVRRRLSPRQASWLFVKEHEQLTADQVVLIERVCQADADLHQLYQLGQDFVAMVKQRQSKRLDTWLARAQRSACVELQGFAFGIKRDYAAVKAGLTLEWSQGQLEGQITRLKVLKRQMYGRARFDLLRLRVLSRA